MRKAASYTVRKGIRYKAALLLSGWESMASNAMIGRKLAGYGFLKVMVLGSARERCAYGTWGGKDMTIQLPKQISSINEAVG